MPFEKVICTTNFQDINWRTKNPYVLKGVPSSSPISGLKKARKQGLICWFHESELTHRYNQPPDRRSLPNMDIGRATVKTPWKLKIPAMIRSRRNMTAPKFVPRSRGNKKLWVHYQQKASDLMDFQNCLWTLGTFYSQRPTAIGQS